MDSFKIVLYYTYIILCLNLYDLNSLHQLREYVISKIEIEGIEMRHAFQNSWSATEELTFYVIQQLN